MPSTFASIADVLKYTGKTVSQGVLDQAEAQIEDVVGVIADPLLRPGVVLKARDAYFLKKAVAYQAGWISVQPDAYERSEVGSLSQDGTSVSFLPGSITLAPFARIAIRRLSWRGTRSLSIGTKDAVLPGYSDDSLPWNAYPGPSGRTSLQDWEPLS